MIAVLDEEQQSALARSSVLESRRKKVAAVVE
jgi:hypothetical protein